MKGKKRNSKRQETKRQADLSSEKQRPSFLKVFHTYYDYELTKRSLRQEGVWRYHYRRSVKMMEKSLEELEKKIIRGPENSEWNKFLYFGRLFLSDIQSFEPNIPPSMREGKTHIAYREAASSIDKAFSGYFSSDAGRAGKASFTSLQGFSFADSSRRKLPADGMVQPGPAETELTRFISGSAGPLQIGKTYFLRLCLAMASLAMGIP